MFTNSVLSNMFWLVFGLELLLIGAVLFLLDYLAKSPRWAHLRIRPFAKNRYSDGRRILNTTLNQVFSVLLFICFFIYAGERVFYNSWWPGFTRLLGETLGVLLLYDFAYYWYHRMAHHPKMMKYMHGVHHWVRNPTAGESAYLNVLEPTGALLILFGSVWLIGPVSQLSWALTFLIYGLTNLIVHSSLIIPHPAFRLFNFWVLKHDAHHQLFRFNFANIFPFWDAMFGTTEAEVKKVHRVAPSQI